MMGDNVSTQKHKKKMPFWKEALLLLIGIMLLELVSRMVG
jgi:hypothetical protein